ncbi:MAG: hypothetical protein IPI85_12220 [Dehalococcoidia bacterium]|nr:hypothetical protein [Dehalococcoidia bacterium]
MFVLFLVVSACLVGHPKHNPVDSRLVVLVAIRDDGRQGDALGHRFIAPVDRPGVAVVGKVEVAESCTQDNRRTNRHEGWRDSRAFDDWSRGHGERRTTKIEDVGMNTGIAPDGEL